MECRSEKSNYNEPSQINVVSEGSSKNFYPEALKWIVYVLNCVGHVHIPNSKRTKVEDKSVRCVLLGEERGGTDSVQNGAQHGTTHNVANENGKDLTRDGVIELVHYGTQNQIVDVMAKLPNF
ncbi:hypothetical protein CR513_53735, partial [Mucuna pruriens]